MEVLMIKKTQQNKSTNIKKKNTNYEQYNIQAWLKNNE
jgi:hypothetical protein